MDIVYRLDIVYMQSIVIAFFIKGYLTWHDLTYIMSFRLTPKSMTLDDLELL